MQREIVHEDVVCLLTSEPSEQEGAHTVSVTINDETIGRVRTTRTLAEMTEAELRSLVGKARKEAALNRWEGEGGNPPPGRPVA